MLKGSIPRRKTRLGWRAGSICMGTRVGIRSTAAIRSGFVFPGHSALSRLRELAPLSVR
jgi:hypothetical protein